MLAKIWLCTVFGERLSTAASARVVCDGCARSAAQTSCSAFVRRSATPRSFARDSPKRRSAINACRSRSQLLAASFSYSQVRIETSISAFPFNFLKAALSLPGFSWHRPSGRRSPRGAMEDAADIFARALQLSAKRRMPGQPVLYRRTRSSRRKGLNRFASACRAGGCAPPGRFAAADRGAYPPPVRIGPATLADPCPPARV
jgi:hypothetical protein